MCFVTYCFQEVNFFLQLRQLKSYYLYFCIVLRTNLRNIRQNLEDLCRKVFLLVRYPRVILARNKLRNGMSLRNKTWRGSRLRLLVTFAHVLCYLLFPRSYFFQQLCQLKSYYLYFCIVLCTTLRNLR